MALTACPPIEVSSVTGTTSWQWSAPRAPHWPNRAALLEEPFREVKVLGLARSEAELHEGELDFLVTRHPMPLPFPEHGHHVVGHPDGHVQELALAGSLVVGDCGLDHVAGAVHLMLVHVGPAVLKAGEGIVGVDVAVVLLRCCELVNPLVAFRLQDRIWIVHQGICHPFQGLVDIRVVEEYPRMLSPPLGGVLEIPDPPGLVLDLVDAHRQGHVLVALEPR